MKTFAEELLGTPTSRDKQRSIGPSSIGLPCERCVAEALFAKFSMSEDDVPNRSEYWVGAAVGTALHERLETLVKEHRPLWVPEQKVAVYEIEGYGLIKGSADFYDPDKRTVGDWKTTTRDKLPLLKQAFLTEPNEFDTDKMSQARYKAETYYGQGNTYAYGFVQAGVPVDTVRLEFIPRDAKTSKDFWAVEFAYDEAYAVSLKERLERIWGELSEGFTPSDYPIHPACYPHNRERYSTVTNLG